MTDTTFTAPPSSIRVGGVLGRTFEILFRDFVKFVVLTAIVWSPLLLLALAALGSGDGSVAIMAISLILAGILGVLGQAAIFYGVFQQMMGRSFAIGDSLSRGLSRFFSIVGLSVCMGIGMLLGFVALIIPGIILYVMWSVAVPACVVEGQGPLASLSRSSELTKGSRWRIFGVLLVIGLVNQIIQAIIQLSLVAAGAPVASAICAFLWSALGQTFSAVAIAVIYHDLRVAREGIDVGRMAAVFD